MENKHETKDVAALMKRLEDQFGDIDLDLELLGLGDEEQVALELEKEEQSADDSPQQPVATATDSNDTITDAEAAALMARLGAQFGDIDMSNLGLGVVAADGEVNTTNNGNSQDNFGKDSDEESSLEEPTPEELEAWQASQFLKGQEIRTKKEASDGIGKMINSVSLRRSLLRDARAQQLSREQARIRLQNKSPKESSDESATKTTTASILDLSGGDTSTFFRPSTAGILEELVSNEVDGDAEILQTSWKRLYASYEEGLGFWNLWKVLKGYDGPTLLVLRCIPSESKTLGNTAKTLPRTACLGFYTTTAWKESANMFGGDIGCKDGDKAFLFSIDEKGQNGGNNVKFFPVERKLGSKNSMDGLRNGYMYCQPSSKNSDDVRISKTMAVTGLGVGGRPTQPRFHLTENFEDCSCLTYDSARVTRDGDLFSCFDDEKCAEDHDFAKALYCFDVIDLEAWGIGGKDWIDHALGEREFARKQHILRFQKVDKQMMWDEGAFGNNTNRRSNR